MVHRIGCEFIGRYSWQRFYSLQESNIKRRIEISISVATNIHQLMPILNIQNSPHDLIPNQIPQKKTTACQTSISTHPAQPTEARRREKTGSRSSLNSLPVQASVPRKHCPEGPINPLQVYFSPKGKTNKREKRQDESIEAKQYSLLGSRGHRRVISQVGDSLAFVRSSKEDVYYRTDSMK